MSTDAQKKPDPNPVLEDLIWLQETREDRLAKARSEHQGSRPERPFPGRTAAGPDHRPST
ncbi:hypothetical protein ACPEIF_22400 [Streptomyces sp. NPDC012600]|uniref:Uncharacterized protein n=1 Tax=Streptomyces stephensoniae TaxID=3375367 RepID=A0ABU2W583_9ACTN|nr:hypothetical protein [Streptomyces griseus]MDT0492685.1 hypothetical protein [Streptomyces griseus]